MKIHHLTVNGLNAPCGYRYDYLTFAWQVEARIVPDVLVFTVELADDAAFSNIIWHTETMDVQNQVTIDADFLQAYTTYHWRVRTNQVTATSTFETAKLNEPWKADWITYEEDAVPAMTFRRTISLSQPVQRARLYVLGFGVYEVMINGDKIGEEYLAPGYHSYDLEQWYQTYDVTHELTPNTDLSIMVGNGWYRGRFVFEGGFENIYGDKQRLIAELHITYDDGTTEVILTDESWLSHTNEIGDNSIYDGEVIDFAAPILPLTTTIVPDSKELLRERSDVPVTIVHTFNPRVFYDDEGSLILDYGQELTGWVMGRVLEAKDEVIFQFAEVLQDGRFYTENLRTARQTFVARHLGEGFSIRPHFTYFGFRYVKVTGLTEEEARGMVAVALQSDSRELFSCTSSHARLNQLLSNIKWSQKDNFLSVPTDCPQRDERMGWTGDLTVFSNTASYNMETRAFLGSFMRLVQTEQGEMDGAVPFFAPYPKISDRDGLNPFLKTPGAAVWSDVMTVVPMVLYRHFGDKGLLAFQVPGMMRYVDWIRRQDDARGGKRLWDFGWQLGDWLALDSGIQGSVFGATDSVLIASVYYYLSALYTSQAATICHVPGAETYADLAEQVRAAIIETYYEGDNLRETPATFQSEVEIMRQAMSEQFGGMHIPTAVDTQTGLALLLHYQLYPSDAARDTLVRRLHERMKEYGGALTTGFVGTPALPHALLDEGLEEEAFALLFREEAPSWLFEVNMGATTTWERWDSLLPDGRISGTGMNSLNHYAYGAVQDFIVEKILGLQLPKEPGQSYTVDPHFPPQLDWITGQLETPNGPLMVSWKRQGDGIALTVEVPVRTHVIYNGQMLHTGSHHITI